MPDTDDHRLRAALTDLGRVAEGRVRPAGPAGVPAAGRRRRRAVQVATGALVLVLAGGATATAARLSDGPSPTAAPTTAGSCAPVHMTVMLDMDGPADRRRKFDEILARPGITSVVFEGRTAGLLSWTFTVPCADFHAVKALLDAVPVTGYFPTEPFVPTPPWTGPSGSGGPPSPLEPARVCDSVRCIPGSGAGSAPGSLPASPR